MARVGILSRIARRLAGFWCHDGGQIALIAALGLPALTMVVAGAIDLSRVASDRSRLQDIADAAALAGAGELALVVREDAAMERVEGLVDGHVSEWERSPTITRSVRVVRDGTQRIMEVQIDAVSPSFFMNLLPPGGWKFDVVSRAVSVARTPLCVLGIQTDRNRVLNLRNSSRLRAPECMVHSNRDILVEGGRIEAEMVQAVGSAQGQISPTPGTGAAEIADPLAALRIEERTVCSSPRFNGDYQTGTVRLPPGVHCGTMKMEGDSRLELAPGEHFFRLGALIVKDDAVLEGQDVAVIFDRASNFEFRDRAQVDLDGRRSGPYAGMVLVASRQNTGNFTITSEHVDRLLGVIYVPSARLLVEGRADVARESAWTVIVAKTIRLTGSASLIINADYGSGGVPVPDGVGPREGGSRLLD